MVGVLGLARSGYAQYQESGNSLSQMLPEDTLAVAVFPNLEQTAQHLLQIPLVAQIMTAQPDPLWSFLRQGNEDLRASFSQSTYGISLTELGTIFHRSAAIAVLDQHATSFGDNSRALPFVFLADVTTTAEALQRLLETRLIPAIQTQEERVEWGVTSFEGTDLYQIATPQFQVYYAFFQHLFILAFQQDALYDVLLNRRDILTTSSHRIALERYLQEPQDAWVYINWHRLQQHVDTLIPHACPGYASLFQTILAQFDWETLLWTIAYHEHGGHERLFLGRQPAQNDRAAHEPGLTTRLWRVGNERFASSRLIPVNTLYYGITRINFAELWQHMLQVIQRDPVLQHRLTPRILTIERALQLDIETALLPVLGPEIATLWFPALSPNPASKSQTDVAIPLVWLIQISDQQRFETIWPKFWTALQVQPVHTVMHGAPVQTIALAGQLAPLTLYTTRIDDFLAVSLSAANLQEIVRSAQSDSPPTHVPTYGYAAGYVDLRWLAKGVRQLLEQRATASTLRQDQLALAALAKEFMTNDGGAGLTWTTTVVAEGFFTESFSPIGGTVMSTLIAWMGWNLLQ